MIRLYKNIFVGDEKDYRSHDFKNWIVIQACKEPYFTDAVGKPDKNHPEYLIAKRGNRYILNMIDSDSINYISKELIDKVIEIIEQNNDKNIFIHCNKGMSRSPTIAFLYLSRFLNFGISPQEAIKNFRKIYPKFFPGKGLSEFIYKYYYFYKNRYTNGT